MDVNCALDDLIDNLEPLEPSLPWSEVLYHKFFLQSEEDWDRLPQVGGGFGSSTTSQRRIGIIYHKSEEDLWDHLPQVGGGFGSSTTSRRRIWIVYHKSEEDLDCLPQVGGGLATFHRKAPVSADYSNFINHALPLSNGHQGLRAPPTWSGWPRYQKGLESSKLPDSAHLSALQTWEGGPSHQKGTESSNLPDLSPLFRTINLTTCRA
jgi:hypothetical protein